MAIGTALLEIALSQNDSHYVAIMSFRAESRNF
jgi:hypothetical protein